MNSIRTRIVARTAILLALTVVFQTAGRYLTPFMGANSNFIVGPLVNACLIIATASVGLSGAAAIAVLSPFGAIMTGAAVPLPFAPLIAVGNFLIVLGFYILMEKNRIGGLLLGAFMKFIFLYAAIIAFMRFVKVPAKQAALLLFSFSWPQLVTALLGGVVAFIVIQAVGKNIDLYHD